MKKVAIIGTQGVPANYGGFETLVENIIGENSSGFVQYTIFCSSKDMKSDLKEYKGARLKYVPLRSIPIIFAIMYTSKYIKKNL